MVFLLESTSPPDRFTSFIIFTHPFASHLRRRDPGRPQVNYPSDCRMFSLTGLQISLSLSFGPDKRLGSSSHQGHGEAELVGSHHSAGVTQLTLHESTGSSNGVHPRR